ncbi:uncharacterized protein LOC105381525 isoform X2 [Plutella xylostella]|nr:uncharacterized protein LOC105381525 isoform X2 [Plutella xylostella]
MTWMSDYTWLDNWRLFLIFASAGIVAACGAWWLCAAGGHLGCVLACCVRRAASERDSAGSCCAPPHYSRCSSFHLNPPPYSEVTSKPDLYPLVITCGNEGDNKSATGGNYLMVHYFRNYVIRAPGSLSATSTAESLNSSFMCNAANETNTVVPPPYSCANSYAEWRGPALRAAPLSAPPRALVNNDLSPDETLASANHRAMVRDSTFDLDLELMDFDVYDGGRKPRLGPSPPVPRSPSHDEVFEHEHERLRHLYHCPCPSPDAAACQSPPQPTSPTQMSRDGSLQRNYRRGDAARRAAARVRKSSLYMPLSTAYPMRPARVSPRASSRSAPATPCGSLVPNLLALSISRHSSRASRLQEENDPLLDDEPYRPRRSHKF